MLFTLVAGSNDNNSLAVQSHLRVVQFQIVSSQIPVVFLKKMCSSTLEALWRHIWGVWHFVTSCDHSGGGQNSAKSRAPFLSLCDPLTCCVYYQGIMHTGPWFTTCVRELGLDRGVHPPEALMHFPPCFRFSPLSPLFPKNFLTPWKISQFLPFPEFFFYFHPPKFLMTFL